MWYEMKFGGVGQSQAIQGLVDESQKQNRMVGAMGKKPVGLRETESRKAGFWNTSEFCDLSSCVDGSVIN